MLVYVLIQINADTSIASQNKEAYFAWCLLWATHVYALRYVTC